MKRVFLAWCVVFLGLVTGCSKDEEILAFAKKLDGFTTEVVSRVEKAQDPKAGVDAAQQYLDTNQAELKSAYVELSGVRGFQVKQETMDRLTNSVTENTGKVMGLKLKYVTESASDKDFDKKLDKLSDSYSAIFGG
jgi:hypothetical protein